MKTQDLRIGNLIRIAGGDYEVEVLNLTNSIFLSSMGMQDIDKVKPIPLTEEWLIKFGFERSEMESYKSLCIGDIIEVIHSSIRDCFDIYVGVKSGVSVSTCNHVHQLQNLYHALTGTELTIK